MSRQTFLRQIRQLLANFSSNISFWGTDREFMRGGVMNNYVVKIIAWIGCWLIFAQTLQADSTSLACYYYDKADPSSDSSIFHAGLPWLWAIGSQNESIYLYGEEKDGFFEVENITGWSDDEMRYANSSEVAKSLCNNALMQAFPESFQEKSVLHMAAKATFLSLSKITPVFENQRDGKDGNIINKLVLFGDSISDQGNFKSLYRVFPKEPYWAGRFSDGKIWVDHFQEKVEISVLNYAFGGAFTDDEKINEISQCSLAEDIKSTARTIVSGSVIDQISSYRQEKITNTKVADQAGTLYTLLIGGNDYLSFLKSKCDVDTFIDYPNDEMVGSNTINELSTKTIENQLYILSEMGARNIMVVNLADFGVIPRILESYNYHSGSNETEAARIFRLSSRLTQITENHNRLLKTRVDKFKANFPQIKVVYVDIFSGLKNMIISMPTINMGGFFKYNLDTNFIVKIISGNKEALINRACYSDYVCKEPHRTLFWDEVHPTSFAHCLLAANIHRQLTVHGLFKDVGVSDYIKTCRPDIAYH